MEGDGLKVQAVFDGRVLRPLRELELTPNTKVLLTIEVVEADASKPNEGTDTVTEPTLFTAQETTYLIIPEDADLREVAVNYWPKEGAAASEVRRRSVAKVPTRQQPNDDSDLLIMDDADGIDSLQN